MSSTVSDAPAPAQKKPTGLNRYPWWSPRFWHGMRMGHYFGLFWRNRFRVHPSRLHIALAIAPCTIVSSILYQIQNLIYGRKIRNVTIENPPIFIVGHWRSGTTHLHELLVRDERFTFPTTFQCFAPNHFLISEWILPKIMSFLLPSKRPMDNMDAGFDHPQEDEFALCGMGAPTPYFRMAFPNNPPPYSDLLNTDKSNAKDLKRFEEAIHWFVRTITVSRDKQVVLKSPPHTGRVGALAKLFPGAKFIHIVRDPYALFPSTRRTWVALDSAQAFQVPRHEYLDEYIFSSFETMYEGFERQRTEIPAENICDIRYEDLIADPLGQVQRLYEELDLGDFERMAPQLQEYVAGQKDYKVNRHELPPELKAEIDRRWAGYREKYGYV